ncbi:MAG: type IV secretion system DNA-binding domain-containing protein [Phycisphaerae bacterium]|nr:type IV secretion system DNA-binding domain-containing protein [Phycisphaerae bacterium]
MVKKVICIIDQQLCPILIICLMLLYFLGTYAGMHWQSLNHKYIHARSCRLMIAFMATLWLYARFDQSLARAKDAKICVEMKHLFINLMPTHLSLTLGIWTGGALSLSLIHNPIPGWCAGGILVAFPYGLFFSQKPDFSMRLLRGSYSLTMQQAYIRLMRIIKSDEKLINWAGLPFPESIREGHFMIIGAIQSAKTVLTRLLMESTLPTIQPGSDRRAIIYDAKKNMLPLLVGMGVTGPIVTFNPCHADAYAYDMAGDVDSFAAASEVSRILIKGSRNENPFFADAARDLFGGILKVLLKTRPKNWTFSEALQIFSNLEVTKEFLLSVPETSNLVTEYLSGDDRTIGNIRSTISSNISKFREIANLWANTLRANPDKKLSMREWISQESILILGNEERLRSPMEAVNQLFISMLGDVVLSLDDSDTRQIMLFYDEFQEGGLHESMLRILTKGRSKGLWALIVLHTLPGLMSVYGEHEAKAIAATCTNKAFLRQDCPETARWAELVLGKAELLQYTRNHANGRYEAKPSITEHVVEKNVVTASQLLRLPLANRERFYGYFVSPLVGVFGGPVHFSKVICPIADVPNFKERPVEDQYFPADPADQSGKDAGKINLMDVPRMTRDILLEASEDDEDSDSDHDS